MNDLKAKSVIEAAIKNLASQPLGSAALRLFEALGYASDRRLSINSLNELRELLDPGGYLTEENSLLSRWRSVHFLFQIAESEIDAGSDGKLALGLTGQWEPKDVRSYVFFALDLVPDASGALPTRTQLGTITRALNRLVPMPVIVLFRQCESLSLAIINRRKNLRDGTRDVLTRVSLIRDIQCRQPHRAHLDILESFALPSLAKQAGKAIRTFNDLDDAWQRILSTEKLNERFYKDLGDWFTWASAEIRLARLPDHLADTPENRKHATQEFTVRLICRELFAWFLKEMGLIPAELLELFDATDKPRVLTRGGESWKKYLDGNHYYRGILQNIFFQALNRPMNERRKLTEQARLDREVTDPKLQKLAYIGKQNLPEKFDYDLFDRIPYLNGGLFDALPEDNLNATHVEGNAFHVPNKLFYARGEDGFTILAGKGKKENRREVVGLNRIFDRYCFTVAENTPLEEDVALDPELLGLVFENLLAEIDPGLSEQEQESVRKASGSYYTPRRIVGYMVNEALHLHLRTRLEKTGVSRVDLQLLTQLFYHAEGVDFAVIADRVVEELDAVRVLDPACGSGAFPMGMLHRMVELLRAVDPDNQRWKRRLLARLPIGMRADAEKGMAGKSYNYLRKLGLIQKNLYGLDIQPLASLIAKLRFFLTLVIEQEVRIEDRAHNYGLQALPNLETNLLCCNTLVDSEHGLLAGPVLENLRAAREEYYQPQTSAGRRQELAEQIGRELATLFPGFAQQTKSIAPKDSKQRYEQDAFWIAEWFKHATLAAPFFNVEAFFPELVATPSSTLAGDFGILGGGSGQKELTPRIPRNPAPFHIVIGNPPYGGTKISDEVKETLALGSKDPYGAFIARFLGDRQRPTPLAEGGVLAYIVSDTFMTIKSHRPLREQMLDHRVHKMVRVSGDTFKAVVNCAVILCQRGTAVAEHTCQMADLTNISIHEQYERFLHLLYQTEGFARRQNVSNQTYAIYYYRQSLVHTNSNLPFFVASPKLFALMNDTTAPANNDTIRGKRVLVRTVKLNGHDVRLIKLGDIAEVKVGLQTGDNEAYLYQNPSARGSYRSIEKFENYILNHADLERITQDDKIRHAVAELGISTSEKKSTRYFGGRYIVPYDKGGESDSAEGWMPNYFVPTDYFIDWSESAVNRMKTLTLREKLRQQGKTGGNDELTSRFQNQDFYFVPGLTWSDAGVYSPTIRLSGSGVFDVKGSRFVVPLDCHYTLLGIACSKLAKMWIKAVGNHSVSTQSENIRELIIPAVLPDAVGLSVREIVAKQQSNSNYDYATNEQLEIDRLVNEAYGLNGADIREVEEWFARRYPKLIDAQRRTLAAKQGKSAEQFVERPHYHLYCDESRHLAHDHEPELLLGLLACPAEQAHKLNAELAALWKKYRLPPHFEVKWTKVSPARLDIYRGVLEWFISTKGVSFRALVLPEKQRLFTALPSESRDFLYYRLYYQLLRGAMEPENRHRVFLDMKDTRGREKLKELQKLLDADTGESKAVENLQHIRSHEVRLMQVTDLLLGAVGFARRRAAKQESSAKRELVNLLEERFGQLLTADSPPGVDKFILQTWHDADALLL